MNIKNYVNKICINAKISTRDLCLTEQVKNSIYTLVDEIM